VSAKFGGVLEAGQSLLLPIAWLSGRSGLASAAGKGWAGLAFVLPGGVDANAELWAHVVLAACVGGVYFWCISRLVVFSPNALRFIALCTIVPPAAATHCRQALRLTVRCLQHSYPCQYSVQCIDLSALPACGGDSCGIVGPEV